MTIIHARRYAEIKTAGKDEIIVTRPDKITTGGRLVFIVRIIGVLSGNKRQYALRFRQWSLFKIETDGIGYLHFVGVVDGPERDRILVVLEAGTLQCFVSGHPIGFSRFILQTVDSRNGIARMADIVVGSPRIQIVDHPFMHELGVDRSPA